MRAARVAFILTAAAFGLAGCAAKSGAGATSTGFVIPIEVENNLTGLSGTSVYIARANGTGRRLLGPVESGRKRTFEYDAKEGTYRLTAKPQGVRADSVISDPFQIQPGMLVQWSIPTDCAASRGCTGRLLTGTR